MEDSGRRIALEREFQLLEAGYSTEVYPGLLQTYKMESFPQTVEGWEVLFHKCLQCVLDTPLVNMFESYYSLTLFMRKSLFSVEWGDSKAKF